MSLIEDEIRTALKDCFDPDLRINIVDLGLVYGIHIEQDKDGPVPESLAFHLGSASTSISPSPHANTCRRPDRRSHRKPPLRNACCQQSKDQPRLGTAVDAGAHHP